METIANIFLKSDTSFEINEISQVPITFDNANYRYYLTLLSFSFLNCSPNIDTQTTFNFITVDNNDTQTTYNKIISPGLYDTNDLISLLNSYFLFDYTDPDTGTVSQKQILEFSINPFDEMTEIKLNLDMCSFFNITSVIIPVTQGSLLNNELFRFGIQDIDLETGHTFYKNNVAFRITTYNNVMLSSSSIPGLVSLYGNDDGVTTSSALYVISSTADPYTLIEYVAIQPIDFPIENVPSLSNYQFKLYDENLNDLKLLPNGTPDFSVKLAIKRIKK